MKTSIGQTEWLRLIGRRYIYGNTSQRGFACCSQELKIYFSANWSFAAASLQCTYFFCCEQPSTALVTIHVIHSERHDTLRSKIDIQPCYHAVDKGGEVRKRARVLLLIWLLDQVLIMLCLMTTAMISHLLQYH
jgi:hypothetical protein